MPDPTSPSTVIEFSTTSTIDLMSLNNIMARQQCPQHGCTCGSSQPPSNNNTLTATTSLIHRDLTTLPFKAHPIYALRRYTIALAIVGIILCAVGTAHYYYDSSPFSFYIFLLFMSVFVCLIDLIAYARKKASDLGNDPKWPNTKFMVCDLVLAVVLFVAFWCCITYLIFDWYYDPGLRVLSAYGALAGLICSFLHGNAFWKQLMARKKQTWLRTLSREPCARCGYTEIEDEASAPSEHRAHPSRTSRTHAQQNVFTYAGPSADFREANVLTPEHSESATEEGLLIGSDFEGEYQTMSVNDETTVDQPESVVVVGKGKAKGKKKACRSEGMSGKIEETPTDDAGG